MATRTLKLVHHKPRPTQCQECGRMLPKQAYRDVCATCRKPAHKRIHMRAIFNKQQSGKRRMSRKGA